MKKLFSILTVLVFVLSIGVFGNTPQSASALSAEECDAVFFETLEETLLYEGKVTMQNSVEKEMIYDINLDPLGYIYTITFESSEGYALVVNTIGIFEVAEIYLDSPSPYGDYFGQKVYISFLTYFIWEDGGFIDATSGLPVDEDIIEELSEKAFCAGNGPLYLDEEYLCYTNKVQNEYGLAKRHPAYLPVGLSNSCTPTAGANIIGYYTRFYSQLIPGFTPGSTMASYYLYKENPSDIDPVVATLYNYMGTNVGAPGTTINGFKNGMITYCGQKNLSISFDSCMQNGSFNYAKAKQNFQNGLPAVLFVDTFSVATFSLGTNEEVIKYLMGTVCHAMAGFGYNEITYTLTNGQTRTDKYIAVATGLITKSKGYFNINYNTQIDEFYSITIS